MRRAAVAVLVAVAAMAAGCGERHHAGTAAQAAELGLEHPPYLGITCAKPNSTRCDSLGLAVWLDRRAERVTARLNGRPIALRSPGEFVRGRGTGWEGYLHPAGTATGALPIAAAADGRWLGDPPAYAVLRLTATFADGSSASRLMRVQLMPGWG